MTMVVLTAKQKKRMEKRIKRDITGVKLRIKTRNKRLREEGRAERKPLPKGNAKYERIAKANRAVRVESTNNNKAIINLSNHSWDKAKISNVAYKYFYGQPKVLK